MSTPQRVCGTCGAVAQPDDNWCEACGADLDVVPEIPAAAEEPAYVPTGPCVSCGGEMSEITDDGYCQLCGTKQPAPGDHVVDDQGDLVVVSDRGRKHGVNEDAGSVGSQGRDRVALVVCDGVSSTDRSEQASQVAAHAARDVMLADDELTAGARMVAAAAAGQTVVVDATPPDAATPPSCTFVAALAETDGDSTRVTVGWLGDSRAYWLDDDGARLLTRDHIWSAEQRMLGQLSDDEIDADPRAHSITRWLGADAIDVTPEVVEITADGAGMLLVCSDGLWNYAPDPAELATIVAQCGLSSEGHELPLIDHAEALVAFANEAGGHDNITVAMARFPRDPEHAVDDGAAGEPPIEPSDEPDVPDPSEQTES